MIPFTATLRSEFTKTYSLRSTRIVVTLAVLLSIALGVLLAVVVGRGWDGWPAAERAAFDPVGAPRIGSLVVILLLTGLAVTIGSSEYASGTIRLTLAATPRRGRVLAAKALVVAGVMLVTGLVASALTFVATQWVLAAYGVTWVGVDDADAVLTVLIDGGLTPVMPLIGFALGLLLRSAAGGVSTVLGLVFVVPLIGEMLPAWWQRNVFAYLPAAAPDALLNSHLPAVEGAAALPPVWAGALATAGWLAAFLGIAYLALQRRDA